MCDTIHSLAPAWAKKCIPPGTCLELFTDDDWFWGEVVSLQEKSLLVRWVKGDHPLDKWRYEELQEGSRGIDLVFQPIHSKHSSWHPQFSLPDFSYDSQRKKKRRSYVKKKKDVSPGFPDTSPASIFPFSSVGLVSERADLPDKWGIPRSMWSPVAEDAKVRNVEGYKMVLVKNGSRMYESLRKVAYTSCPPGLSYFESFRTQCCRKWRDGSRPNDTGSVYDMTIVDALDSKDGIIFYEQSPKVFSKDLIFESQVLAVVHSRSHSARADIDFPFLKSMCRGEYDSLLERDCRPEMLRKGETHKHPRTSKMWYWGSRFQCNDASTERWNKERKPREKQVYPHGWRQNVIEERELLQKQVALETAVVRLSNGVYEVASAVLGLSTSVMYRLIFLLRLIFQACFPMALVRSILGNRALRKSHLYFPFSTMLTTNYMSYSHRDDRDDKRIFTTCGFFLEDDVVQHFVFPEFQLPGIEDGRKDGVAVRLRKGCVISFRAARVTHGTSEAVEVDSRGRVSSISLSYGPTKVIAWGNCSGGGAAGKERVRSRKRAKAFDKRPPESDATQMQIDRYFVDVDLVNNGLLPEGAYLMFTTHANRVARDAREAARRDGMSISEARGVGQAARSAYLDDNAPTSIAAARRELETRATTLGIDAYLAGGSTSQERPLNEYEQAREDRIRANRAVFNRMFGGAESSQ